MLIDAHQHFRNLANRTRPLAAIFGGNARRLYHLGQHIDGN